MTARRPGFPADARRAKLTFGLDDIGRQLERLGAVLDYAAAQGKEIRTVNLMVERNIPAVLGDPAALELESAAPQEPFQKSDAPAEKVAEKAATKPSETKAAAPDAEHPKSTDKKTNPLKKKPTVASTSTSRTESVVRRAESVTRAVPVN